MAVYHLYRNRLFHCILRSAIFILQYLFVLFTHVLYTKKNLDTKNCVDQYWHPSVSATMIQTHKPSKKDICKCKLSPQRLSQNWAALILILTLSLMLI